TLSHDFDLAITADPANGSTLSYLKEIYLFLNMPYAINNKIDNPVIVKGQNTGFKCLAHIESAGMMGAKIVLDEHITKADTYIIEIKAGVVGDYVYGESSFKAGTTHDKCTLTYIIDGKYAGKSVLIDPAEGEVKSLKTFNLTYFELAATAPTWDKSATPYIEDAQGAKTYLEFQTQTESTNVVTVELANEITAEGRYKLVIPSGAVCNGSTGDPLTEELTYNYTVNPNQPDAITDITLNNNNANVYTVAGQLVKKGAKAADIKQLPASLYIVNGKKVVVK
ncbi:MAG: hypothetical protein HUK05_03750, partial [Prevotella sp.]|nr:hypothetical protein [Prevotella sp.]